MHRLKYQIFSILSYSGQKCLEFLLRGEEKSLTYHSPVFHPRNILQQSETWDPPHTVLKRDYKGLSLTKLVCRNSELNRVFFLFSLSEIYSKFIATTTAKT